MKICYLSDAGSVHTVKWCDYFRKCGHEIVVISLRYAEIEGVKVYGFGESEFRKRTDISKIKYIKYSGKIRSILKAEQPDILHAHYATSYGLLGSFTNFHPYILSVWGSDVYDFPEMSFFHRKMVEYNLGKADALLSTSKAMAKVTEQYTDKKIYITPFGVDMDVYHVDPAFHNEDFIVGTVKTLEPKYGLTYLIEGFAMLKNKYKDDKLKLHIAGRGNQEQELRDLAKDLGVEEAVTFLGFINQQQVVQAFNSFKVAVFPSVLDSESFGVAAVEAQACGVPVVASNVGGLPEATSPGVSSLIVEPRNSEAIFTALETLYLDPELQRKMGVDGRQFVEDHYDVNDNLAYASTIYDEVLARLGKGEKR